jgi:hypothetical protein
MFSTTTIAIYAAVVSTVAVILSGTATAALLLDRRRRVKVVIRTEPYKRGSSLLVFIATNTGHHPVRLLNRGIVLPEGKKLGHYPVPGGLPDPRLPTDLPPGQRVAALEFPAVVAGDLRRWGYSGRVKIRAYYEDETLATHRSRPYPIDLDRLSDSAPTRSLPKFDEEVARLRAGEKPSIIPPSGGLI